MSRFISWFSTQNGKYFTRTCVGVAAFSLFSTNLAMNTIMIDRSKSIFQLYKDGKPQRLSPLVSKIVTEVLQDCKLSQKEKKKLKFFSVIGDECFHFGGTNSPWGACVGIPFLFEDKKDINFQDLRLEDYETIDWVIDGRDLVDALTLSENAKKFRLMREIHCCDIWETIDNGFILSGSFLLSALLAYKTNQQVDAFNRFGVRMRLIVYLFSFTLGSLMYRCFQDPTKHFSDRESDRKAAETGPEYLEGGIEYYQKHLEKNRILRNLLGEQGEEKWDQYGDLNYVVLAPKMPITKRLSNLVKMKKEQAEGSDAKTK